MHQQQSTWSVGFSFIGSSLFSTREERRRDGESARADAAKLDEVLVGDWRESAEKEGDLLKRGLLHGPSGGPIGPSIGRSNQRDRIEPPNEARWGGDRALAEPLEDDAAAHASNGSNADESNSPTNTRGW